MIQQDECSYLIYVVYNNIDMRTTDGFIRSVLQINDSDSAEY